MNAIHQTRKLVTPKVDLAFKKIFCVEENKDLLISLINSTVSQEDQVKEVTLLDPYNSQDFINDKLSIFDLKAVGETGKRFNIEIQITDEADYDQRALFYWAKLYTEQLRKGQSYYNLNKSLGIHILNFISIADNSKYHNVFHITETETGVRYFTDFELHTIELTKFSKDLNEDLETLLKKINNSLDVWAAFLTHHDLMDKDNLPKPLANDTIKKALNVLETMNFTPAERETYQAHLKWLRLEASALEKASSDGQKIGEQKRTIEIARAMLKEYEPVEKIVRFTGLSIQELEKLADK